MEKTQNPNYHSVCGCIGAHNESVQEREQHDFYATSPVAIEKLMEVENISPRVWECACGLGHLSIPLIMAGHEVKSTDLIDRGFGKGGVDFLKCNDPFDGDIITNPPYKYAQKFVEHGLELIPEGRKVCMLLKVQFLEGKMRRRFFEKYPPAYIYVSSSRIQHGRNGKFTNANSMMAVAWYIWIKGYQGETILRWFN